MRIINDPFERLGLLADMSDVELFKHPLKVHSFNERREFFFDKPESNSYFVYVQNGVTSISVMGSDNRQQHFVIKAGMYALINKTGWLTGGEGIIIEAIGYQGMFMIGGSIERSGRIQNRYGVGQSILVHPVQAADPFLSASFFYDNMGIPELEYPFILIGLVTRGTGVLIGADEVSLPLNTGDIFIIPPGTRHRFETHDDPMVIINYEPVPTTNE